MTSKNKMIARIGVGVVALALLGCIGYLAFNLDQQKKENKENLRYMLRYSQDTAFKDETTVTVRTRWPFYNPEKDLKPGEWKTSTSSLPTNIAK